MKNILSILASVLFITLYLNSCEKAPVVSPSEDQIKAIFELTTVEAYYNNLAKSTKTEDGLFADKEREFWFEYEGYAKIGIDMSKVSMKVSDNNITITMPHANLQEIGFSPESLDENSCIYSSGGWFFPLKIKAEDQTAAVKKAQEKMKAEVLKNNALFVQAENKAKKLIENYINKLGEMSGVEYNIIWKIVDNAPSNAGTQE